MQPQIPMQPRVGASGGGTFSLDTTGLESKLQRSQHSCRYLQRQLMLNPFETIIADLNSQVANLTEQLNNVNASRQNLRALLLQIDGLIDEDNNLMTVTTEDGNRQNLFAIEPKMYIDEGSLPHNEKAERLNGRLAMLGVIAAIGAYATTGQLIPGFF